MTFDPMQAQYKLSNLERFKLIGFLNSLPSAQFNQVLLALNPPNGIVASRDASQGERTFDLFEWVEGSTGPGIVALLELLKNIPCPSLDEILKASSPRYRVTLDLDSKSIDVYKLKKLIDGIGDLVGDDSIRIVGIDEGSLKLELTGDPEKLKLLKRLFKAGGLQEISGTTVTDLKRVGDHVGILQQGSSIWDEWRRNHPDLIPNLSGVNLRSISLKFAVLSNADFRDTNLSFSDLRWADLSNADLSGANLSGADLSGANLSGANLSNADLIATDFKGANLSDTRFDAADLSFANLSTANLSGANVVSAGFVEKARFGLNPGLITRDELDLQERGAAFINLSGLNLLDIRTPT